MASEIKLCEICSEKGKKIISDSGFDLCECRSCGLIYVSNPPQEKDLKKIYSKGYHSHENSNQEGDYKIKKQMDRIEKFLKKGSILDIGCSRGKFLVEARKRGWRVKGVEISEYASKIAGEKGLEVITGKISEDDFEENEFDVVYMGDVIEHLYSPRDMLKLIKKILKKNGFIVLTTPNSDGLGPRISKIFSRTFGFWTHATPPEHLFQFSKKTLVRLLREESFHKVKIFDNGPLVENPIYYFRARSLQKKLKGLIYFGLFYPFYLIGSLTKNSSSMTIIAKNG